MGQNTSRPTRGPADGALRTGTHAAGRDAEHNVTLRQDTEFARKRRDNGDHGAHEKALALRIEFPSQAHRDAFLTHMGNDDFEGADQQHYFGQPTLMRDPDQPNCVFLHAYRSRRDGFFALKLPSLGHQFNKLKALLVGEDEPPTPVAMSHWGITSIVHRFGAIYFERGGAVDSGVGQSGHFDPAIISSAVEAAAGDAAEVPPPYAEHDPTQKRLYIKTDYRNLLHGRYISHCWERITEIQLNCVLSVEDWHQLLSVPVSSHLKRYTGITATAKGKVHVGDTRNSQDDPASYTAAILAKLAELGIEEHDHDARGDYVDQPLTVENFSTAARAQRDAASAATLAAEGTSEALFCGKGTDSEKEVGAGASPEKKDSM